MKLFHAMTVYLLVCFSCFPSARANTGLSADSQSFGSYSETSAEAIESVKDSQAQLLALAESITLSDSALNQERERLFSLALSEQEGLYNDSLARLKAAEQEQERLKVIFDANENTLADLEEKLTQRSGALGEVFGVAKESALELAPMLMDSITSADHPGRTEALAFSESKRVPTINDFQALLVQFASELRASGQVASFEAAIIDAMGKVDQQTVTRFGVFSAATQQGDYLAWDFAQQKLKVLATQPENYVGKENGLDTTVVLLDPTRGELFALLDRMPTLQERIEQGGVVGYLIIALGLLGLFVACYQIIRLLLTEVGVRKQLANCNQITNNNPLGRVLHAVEKMSEQGDDSKVELKVDEAILKELPKIEQGQSFLKLLAAVAPLLGLLGTVMGMIATFQSITLFGTSDPKLMAAGISQALMTTVLGLVVAVPILFCHSLLVARGRRLVQILQEKSLAALVRYSFSENAEAVERNISSESDLHVA